MTNSIALAGGTGLISREDLAKSLNNAAMSMPSVAGDKAFLKMDRMNGDWLFGQEETVVEDGSLWAINPTSLKHGWVAWDTNGGGAPVQEVMVPISRALPAMESLPPLGMGSPDKKTGRAEQLVYQRQQSVDLVCISGEDAGTQAEYKQSSAGAMKLFSALTNSLLDQLGKDPENIVAVGKLTSETYKHKTYGRINNPIFTIVEWRGIEDISPVAAKPAEAIAAKEPEPAPRTRTRPTATAQVAVADPDDGGMEEAELAKEYAEVQAAGGGTEQAPRRRMRR